MYHLDGNFNISVIENNFVWDILVQIKQNLFNGKICLLCEVYDKMSISKKFIFSAAVLKY